MIYLYVKTHNKTGLKYFGKTVKDDPINYPGSGIYWTRHLKKHGTDLSTEIIGVFEDVDEARRIAIDFSVKNDIVNSPAWANLIIENAVNGGDSSHLIDYSYLANNQHAKGARGNKFAKGPIGNKGLSGKFFITNGILNRPIPIDSDIPSGWYKGRTCKPYKKKSIG